MTRAIRSYVIRDGRITRGQLRALEELLPRYAARVEDLRRMSCPLFLEIGIGNGDNLVKLGAAAPDTCYVGCEPHRPGIGHALLEIERLGLANVRLWPGDATELLEALSGARLSGAYIYFPDPWPKKRHHKRRLVSATFLALLHRRFRPNAVCRFASDDEDYADTVRALIAASPQWYNIAGPGCFAPRPVARPHTRFEQRALAAGRAIYELAFMPAAG